MSTAKDRRPKLPPAWFMHAFWRVHRALHRLSGGRFLWTPASKRGWGALRLTTVGRKSGRDRSVIVGYIEDGPNLVMLAMNGWDEGHPAWWLNLEAHPDATARLAHHGPCLVHAHAAEGEERDRLWQRWAEIGVGLDAYASGRSTTTPVVVLEPRRERTEQDRLTGHAASRTIAGVEGRFGHAPGETWGPEKGCRGELPPLGASAAVSAGDAVYQEVGLSGW